jgi:hypothetical protein
VVALALTLTGSPPKVVRVAVASQSTLGSTDQATSVCQGGERIPPGVSAIRVGLEGSLGPAVLLKAFAGGRMVAHGGRPGNWTDDSVTIPVRPSHAWIGNAKHCFYVPHNSELLQLYGSRTGAREAAYTKGGESLPGRFSVEYLAAGKGSWWSRLMTVARHMASATRSQAPGSRCLWQCWSRRSRCY